MEIHRCRFADYQPQAINSIAHSPSTWKGKKYMAVGRASGNIELWAFENKYFLEKTIPGPVGIGLESLIWTHQTKLTEEDELLYDTPEEQTVAINNLVSAPPRLFSSTTNGAIIEWDTSSLLPKKAVDTNGGAVWKLAVNNSHTTIASANDDGRVRLFDITDGSLTLLKAFEQHKCKFLSLAWSNDDKTLFAGTDSSSIFCYDVESAKFITKMTTMRPSRGFSIVWDLLMLKDNTLVSADSLSNITFWNSEMYVIYQVINPLEADVTCLALNHHNNTIFASGVGGKIVQLKNLNPRSNSRKSKNDNGYYEPSYNKWHNNTIFASGVGGKIVQLKNLNPRSNSRKSKNDNGYYEPSYNKWVEVSKSTSSLFDIRAISFQDFYHRPITITGGVSGELMTFESQIIEKKPKTILPFFPPQNGVISFSDENRLALMRTNDELKLWKIGSLAQNSTNLIRSIDSGTTVTPESGSKFLISLRPTKSSSIASSAISPNGRWIAFSDNEKLKLFRVIGDQNSQETTFVKKVPHFFEIPPKFLSDVDKVPNFATQLHFTKNNKYLVVATSELILYFIKIDEIINPNAINELDNFLFSVSMINVQHRLDLDPELQNSSYAKSVSKDNIHVCLKKNITLRKKLFCSINTISSCPDSKFVVSTDTAGHIVVTDLESLSIHSEIPVLAKDRRSTPISTAIVISKKSRVLAAIAYSSHEIYLWDIGKRKMAEWSNQNPPSKFPQFFTKAFYVLHKILSSPGEPGILYAYGTHFICRIDTNNNLSKDDSIIYDAETRIASQNKIIDKALETESDIDSANYTSLKPLKNNSNLYEIEEEMDCEMSDDHVESDEMDNIITKSSKKSNEKSLITDPFSFESKYSETLTKILKVYNAKKHTKQSKTSDDAIPATKLSRSGVFGREKTQSEISKQAILDLLNAGAVSKDEFPNFSYTRRYNNILGAGIIGYNQLAIFERPITHAYASLPPALSRKKYGQ
ncbi:U3 small nucleolar RNA-associated protein 4 [Smittium culicis]|uniref:U3 small nucleolar RNA-associated protein 4 n=1 Tax=Smittium culicis TaxID=133412 RepID=A0A1R1YAF3_9FUNG|nr:U3 small nucleolar RNA-associated protein 4 [Smittium culicis]